MKNWIINDSFSITWVCSDLENIFWYENCYKLRMNTLLIFCLPIVAYTLYGFGSMFIMYFEHVKTQRYFRSLIKNKSN
ncbi:MAG: hypothetical protein R2831_08690 [Chitinophagaceae bacterium]